MEACQPFLQVASLHGDKNQHLTSSVFLSGSLYLAQLPPPRSSLGFWVRRGKEELKKRKGGQVATSPLSAPRARGHPGITQPSVTRLYLLFTSRISVTVELRCSQPPELGTEKHSLSLLAPAVATTIGKIYSRDSGSVSKVSPLPTDAQ